MTTRHPADRGAARWLPTAAILVIVFAALASVAASPFALQWLVGASGQWEQLSFIGQTYGAISALIAVFALVGIVGTLVYQARETKRAVEETRRQATGELLRMAMEDPDLDECWGPVPESSDPKVRKQQLYVNMIVSQWMVAFATGTLPEPRLRAIAREMFSAVPGRVYWQRARTQRLATMTDRGQRRFNEILDEAYRSAQAPLVFAAVPEPGRAAGRPGRALLITGTLAGALLGAAVGAATIRTHLRRRLSR